MKLSNEVLDDVLKSIFSMLLENRDYFYSGFLGKSLSVEKKEDASAVTEYDMTLESNYNAFLNKKYPEVFIVGEENYQEHDQDTLMNKDFCFVIDPIDGTNNFINKIPFFSSSIGLVHQGKPVLGVIFNPVTQEIFYGHQNLPMKHGILTSLSTKNHETVKANDKRVKVLSPASDDYCSGKNSELFSKILMEFKTRGVSRRLGSAALELAYLQCGRFSIYWEEGVKPWDTAAALALNGPFQLRFESRVGKYEFSSGEIIAYDEDCFNLDQFSSLRTK